MDAKSAKTRQFRPTPFSRASPIDTEICRRIFPFMKSLAEEEKVSVNRKLAMIDELWEDVRRSGVVPVPGSHIAELESRVRRTLEDSRRALPPKVARAALRK